MSIRHRKTPPVIAFMMVLVLATLCGAGPTPAPKSDFVPDSLIAFGSEDGPRYAVIVEKQTQTLHLFSHDGGMTREVLRFTCSTGEAAGPKAKSGDRKTPEGIYFFTKEHLKKDLSPIYGTRAYPIDYPNILDRLAGRDGNSIWLHGTNKPLKPRDSNGCIVLENSDIDLLAEYITLYQTPMIILDRLTFDAVDFRGATERALESFLRDWTRTLQGGTYHAYLAHYAPEYLPDMAWWPGWNRLRDGTGRAAIISEPAAIYRYKDLFVLLFDQSLRSGDEKKPVGKRKLFVREDGGRYRIVGDEYLAAAVDDDPPPSESPLTAVYRTFLAESGKGADIEEMIDGWLKAWSAKDIDAYGDYYAKQFRSQGMSRRRWLSYKDRLNRKYDYIKVTADDLTIEAGDGRSVATFLQTYRSPLYRAVGIKTLVLVRENGRWKIFRETWKKR